MAYERGAWVFAKQVRAFTTVQDRARYFLWFAKAFLCGQIPGSTAVMTIIGSSDGVTGGPSSTDRWGNVYDPAKLVRGAPGAPHSWVLLRQTVSYMGQPNPLLLLSFNNALTDNFGRMQFIRTYTAGSGDVNNDPTVGDAIGQNAAGIVQAVPAAGTQKIAAGASMIGDFYIAELHSGQVFASSGLLHFALADARNNDTWPYLSIASWGAGLTTTTAPFYVLASPGTMKPDVSVYGTAVVRAPIGSLPVSGDAYAAGTIPEFSAELGGALLGATYRGRAMDVYVLPPLASGNLCGNAITEAGVIRAMALHNFSVPSDAEWDIS